MQYRYTRIVYPMLTVLAVLAAWEVLVTTFGIPEFILPAPSRVALTLYADNKMILAHTWITLGEILLGFFGAAVLGIVLAFLITTSTSFETSARIGVLGEAIAPGFSSFWETVASNGALMIASWA